MNIKKCKGVTFIELMVALAIMAIIASVAYPAYTGYKVVANRIDAKVIINKLAIAQERFFSNNNSYTVDLSQLPGYTTNPVISEKGYYSLSATAGAGGIGTSFILTATAIGSQVNDSCKSLTLNSAGIKNGTPTKDDCWAK